MVNSKNYDPTITRFRKHTQSFVSEKTRKGHLNDDGDDDRDVLKGEGILVRVHKNLISGKGWEVKYNNKTYMCTYGDNIVYLPPYTETDTYYLPKKKCAVEISIDKKTKINTITRIKDPNKQPITLMQNSLTLQSNGDASITITNDATEISGTELSVENDIVVNTSKDNDLPDKISVTDLYKKVQSIELKLSDTNDSE